MDAVIVKAVPARALRALAVTLQIGLAPAFIDHVVFARHIMKLYAGFAEDLVGIVEFFGLGKMRDVAGVNDERRLHRHRLHLGDGFAQRAQRIRVRLLVKADVTVAHLQEGEAGGLSGSRFADQADGMRNATIDRPKHPGSRPDHAFQHFPAAYSLPMIVKAFLSHINSPCGAERPQMALNCAGTRETRPAPALFPRDRISGFGTDLTVSPLRQKGSLRNY